MKNSVETVFIYVLKDPHTNQVRYVGKSSNPEVRFYHHLKESNLDKTHKHRWIKLLLKSGKTPHLEIIDQVLEVDWRSWEAAWIQFYLEEGCSLVNGTLGGEGWSKGKKHTPEAVRKSSAPHIGKPLSIEHRRKISLSKMGNRNSAFGKPSWNKGIPHTLETREKMSLAKIGNKNAQKRILPTTS